MRKQSGTQYYYLKNETRKTYFSDLRYNEEFYPLITVGGILENATPTRACYIHSAKGTDNEVCFFTSIFYYCVTIVAIAITCGSG